MTTVIIVLLVLIVGAAAAVFFLRKKPVPPPAPPSPAPETTGDGRTSLEKLFSNLLEINLFLRLQAAPAEIMTLVEGIIDDTRTTLPAMVERYPDETLTYRMEKICETDLMRQLKEYFDLSEESRKTYNQDMIQRLTDIHRLIGRAKKIVEHNEVSEFKMIARELEIKFGQGA
jgi:uncharacterized protein YfkK (UPF0435 family)